MYRIIRNSGVVILKLSSCRTHPISNKKSSVDRLSCFLLGVRYCTGVLYCDTRLFADCCDRHSILVAVGSGCVVGPVGDC